MLSRSSPSDTEFINRLCPASHSLAILKALDLNANCSLQSSSFSITATVFEINHPSDKIAHVVLVDQNHYNNRSHLATISTSSQTLPPQPQQTTLFILKNEQCGLASFFKKGDTVIMYQPGMDVDHNNHHRQQHHHQNMIHLLYGPSTILFCIPESSETDKIKNNTSNNHYLTSSASSSLPIIDCTRIPSRILIKDLKPYMTGVTLLGRIEYLSGNVSI